MRCLITLKPGQNCCGMSELDPLPRRCAGVIKTVWFRVHSCCWATPSMQFLFTDKQLRSTLPSHTRSPSCSCASLAVINLREDLHLQECARAGRTEKKPPEGGFFTFTEYDWRLQFHAKRMATCFKGSSSKYCWTIHSGSSSSSSSVWCCTCQTSPGAACSTVTIVNQGI